MRGIQVVHESFEKPSVLRDAHLFLRQAKHIIFLGFGYLDRNVVRLNLQANRMKNTSYWVQGWTFQHRKLTRMRGCFLRILSGMAQHTSASTQS